MRKEYLDRSEDRSTPYRKRRSECKSPLSSKHSPLTTRSTAHSANKVPANVNKRTTNTSPAKSTIKPSSLLLERLQKFAEKQIAIEAEKIKIHARQYLQKYTIDLNNDLTDKLEREKGSIISACSQEFNLNYDEMAVSQLMRPELEKPLYDRIRKQLEPEIKLRIKMKIEKEAEDKSMVMMDTKLKEFQKKMKAEYATKIENMKKTLELNNKRQINKIIAEKEIHLKKIASSLYEQDTKELEERIFSEYDKKYLKQLEQIEREHINFIAQKAAYVKKVKEQESNMTQTIIQLQKKKKELKKMDIDSQREIALEQKTPEAQVKKLVSASLIDTNQSTSILKNSQQIIEKEVQCFDKILNHNEEGSKESVDIGDFLISNEDDINEFTDY